MEDKKAVQSTEYGMDTLIIHKVYGEQAEEALAAAKKEAARLESLLSRFIPGSDISHINSAAGKRPVTISSETMEILSEAIKLSTLCKGRFDVTIGPLVDLWREAGKKRAPVSAAKLKRILPLVCYKDLHLDSSKQQVYLHRKGQSIDLGGIGKGYAADRVLEIMRSYGITSAFTNFGGNVAAIGRKPDGSPWKVGIQHPRQDNRLIGALQVTNMSVVTSGDYQRCFIGDDGTRYHHILDPITGYPSYSGLISATVIAESSMTADALSTALFILGLEAGAELLKTFDKINAVLIDESLQVHISKGLCDDFQPDEGIQVRIINA